MNSNLTEDIKWFHTEIDFKMLGISILKMLRLTNDIIRNFESIQKEILEY
jgi:hypothetical protein